MALNTQKVTLKISAGTPRQIPGDPKTQIAFRVAPTWVKAH